MENNTLPLEKVRWKLAVVWFSCGGFIFIILVLQSLSGIYGDNVQRVWGWALPNFLPTLALMVSVFAADSLNTEKDKKFLVRKNFSQLSVGLSIFYLLIFIMSILSPPLLDYFNSSSSPIDRIKILETSNLWLGPLQGLVVVALGVLFFLKQDESK